MDVVTEENGLMLEIDAQGEKPSTRGVSRDEHDRQATNSRNSSTREKINLDREETRSPRDEKEHRNETSRRGNKKPPSTAGSESSGGEEKKRKNPSFHRLSKSGSTLSTAMDLLTAQQEIAGQKQLNKEEARRLKQLSLKLEHEKKVINQHRANLEKDKEALQKEKKDLQEDKRQHKLAASGTEDQRGRNENERQLLSKWNRDLDTREKVVSQKERKLLRQQQEFEEHKKQEMLSVHNQRQADIDSVKEENDRLRAQLLKEVEERRDLEKSFILRDQEALRQERINWQRRVDNTEQSHQTREAQLRDWEQSLLHERRQINMDKDRVEQIKHETEVLKNKVYLENKAKQQNAQLANRKLEEKRQVDHKQTLTQRDKLKNEISKKNFEVEQRQSKYERHNMATESELEMANRTKEKKLDEKEKIVELRAEQKAKILKAQQKSWETTQFENIKNLTSSIVS